MESLIDSLRPLNLALFASGCPLIPFKWKIVNFLSNLHAAGLTLISIYAIITSESDIAHPSMKTSIVLTMMMYIWNMQYHACSTIFIFIVRRSGRKLNVLLDELSKYLSAQDHAKIRRFMVCLVVHKIIYYLIVKLIIGIFYVRQKTHL